MDRRALILLGAAPAGLAVGAAAWLLAAKPTGAATFSRLEERLSALESRHAAPAIPPEGMIQGLAATPLFAFATGPGAVADISITLQGLVRAPGRIAALLSISGGAPDWLELGQTRDGVTLQDVSGSRVVVDTALGAKELALGQAPAAAAGDGSPPPPPGLKGPPPPASAPGSPR